MHTGDHIPMTKRTIILISIFFFKFIYFDLKNTVIYLATVKVHGKISMLYTKKYIGIFVYTEQYHRKICRSNRVKHRALEHFYGFIYLINSKALLGINIFILKYIL